MCKNEATIITVTSVRLKHKAKTYSRHTKAKERADRANNHGKLPIYKYRQRQRGKEAI